MEHDRHPINTSDLIAAINVKESRLQQARNLLADNPVAQAGKHVMSAEARARISAAQKKRWARTKRAPKRG